MSTATPAPTDSVSPAPLTLRDRLGSWREILETANPPESRPLDTVGKWLVITRAAVFPMTIWSGLIGGLLAVEAARTKGGAPVDWGLFLIAVVGLVLAHAANNMINDYFDSSGGPDTEGYVRALYAPHPILSGWVTRETLRNAILLATIVDGLIMVYLAAVVSPLIIVFALAGLFLSVFYVAPPIRLKWHGLGEPDVLLVWGPLMIGGTYLAATATIDRTTIEICVRDGECKDEVLVALCHALRPVSPRARETILRTPFGKLSYRNRHEDRTPSVPVGFWRHRRGPPDVQVRVHDRIPMGLPGSHLAPP